MNFIWNIFSTNLFHSGQTALHKAAGNRRRSICYMLVAAGASLLLQDNQGYTPKILAIHADDHELAAYLESESSLKIFAWRNPSNPLSSLPGQEQFQNMNHTS